MIADKVAPLTLPNTPEDQTVMRSRDAPEKNRGTLRIARTNRCLGPADFGLQRLDIFPQLRHIPAVKDHGLKARRAPGAVFFLDRGHFFSFRARAGFDPGRASLYRNRNKAGVALARPPLEVMP
jgi:hypothetical protein